MSRTARVVLAWGDGRHPFRLGIDQLDELDEVCRIGPGYLLAQLNVGVYGPWKARDVRETIRLGLVGGGMTPDKAIKLVERYFDASPVGDHLVTAQAILMAAVVGDESDPKEDDASGEPKGESHPSKTAASGSDPSTKSPAPSGSPTSDGSASGSSTAITPAGGAPTSPRTRRRKA